MYSHCPSQTHKVYPFCPNISEEVPVNENKSLCDYYCDLITEYLSDKEKALQCAKEVMRDDIYIKMLSMLNNLTQKEICTLFLVFKTMQKTLHEEKEVHNYLKDNIKKVINCVASSLAKIDDSSSNVITNSTVIEISGKILNRIIKDEDYLPYILSAEFFEILSRILKSVNISLLRQGFHLIVFMFESTNERNEKVAQFLESHEKIFSDFINNLLVSLKKDNSQKNYYYMRETLTLLEKILNNPSYEKFCSSFTNDIEILKLVMKLMNDSTNQITIKAVNILNFFFSDIESKDLKIKEMLFTNKENFANFFNNHTDIPEIDEKKDFILYELERLKNLLND